jgi:hypothetical protein
MSNATATPAPRQRRKPIRFAQLLRYGAAVVLRIREVLSKTREQLDTYTLEPIPADFGRGLLLHKPDGTSYAVNLSGPDSTCDCPGFERWGWHTGPDGEPVACKHVSALLALQQAGRL